MARRRWAEPTTGRQRRTATPNPERRYVAPSWYTAGLRAQAAPPISFDVDDAHRDRPRGRRWVVDAIHVSEVRSRGATPSVLHQRDTGWVR